MEAGKLIGEGSKTCVFKPNLPCKNKKTEISNKNISKVFLTKKEQKYLQGEIDFNKKIDKLTNSKIWTVTLFNKCDLNNYKDILKIEKDMKKCLKSQKVSIEDFNKNKYMLYGLYGGISMSDNINKMFKNELNSKLIYNFLKKTHSLFYGLTIMNQNRILHYDIKKGNIVYNNNKFKYIDYGISTTFNNIKSIKKRAIREYNANRIYEYYPYELFYIFLDKNTINDELIKKPFTKRDHHDHLEYINNVAFNRNVNDEIMNSIKKIKNNEIKLKQVVESLDIYSLGITLINILIDLINKFNNNKNINKNKINIQKVLYHPTMLPITKLLKKMTELSCDERIKSSEALNKLEEILNYYPKY